jgi:hypothetical protein
MGMTNEGVAGRASLVIVAGEDDPAVDVPAAMLEPTGRRTEAFF